METLDRITQAPDVMGGKPCLRGMRVTVGMILRQLGTGRSIDDLLADFPYLEREDIFQAVRYGASLADVHTTSLPGLPFAEWSSEADEAAWSGL